jgi:uncharacterized membrane protein YidH (DUF202 family)
MNIVKKSILSPNGKESSTRIATYIILLLVVIFSILFFLIELYHAYKNGGIISNEIIIVFGMLLTHHLTLLGINKYNETKQQIEKKR